MKGELIVFEGPDQVGKTTIMNDFVDKMTNSKFGNKLLKNKKQIIQTKEPGSQNSLCQEIRKKLLNPSNDEPTPLTELFLYLADRAQHQEKIIAPQYLKGNIIISDRYWHSTLVYQVLTQEVISYKLFKEIMEEMKLISPDLIIFLKTDGSLCSKKNNRMDDKCDKFSKEINKHYDKLYKTLSSNYKKGSNRVLQYKVTKDNIEKLPTTIFEKVVNILGGG